MGINVERYRGAMMPQLSLDVFYVFALVDQKARIGMSQIVESDSIQTC
jgi:hypothetical protein